MMKFRKIAALGAGMAAIVVGASPASAQGYPYGYSNNNGSGVVGAIINSVTGGGYGQYPMGNYGYARTDTRTSVSQCVAAVERGRSGYGQGYNQGYGYQGQGYQGQGYGNQRYGGGLRVVGITSVERRSNGGLRVSGIVQSGANAGYGQGYGQQGYYGYEGQGYQGQGGGRPPHNDNNGYNQGYGNQAYNNGYGGNGYANNGYAARVSSRFSCKVDSRGVVTDVRVDQGSGYRRGY